MPPGLIRHGDEQYPWLFIYFHSPALVRTPSGTEKCDHSLMIWEPRQIHHYGNELSQWDHSWLIVKAPSIRPLLENSSITLNTPMDVEAGEIFEKYLTLLDYAQDDFMGLSYDDGNKKFANGDAVMIINGNWAISQYRNANPDVKINMFALPSSNDESQNKVTSGVDVLLGVSKSSSNVDAAKDFVSFMMEKENVQTYIDEQFSFSALKGVEQSDEAVSGVQEDISNGKVANFEDHYYPSGFDMSALLTELSLNRANGMDDKENIEQFLKQCDEKYDVANVD